jgi:hypothetical protein
MSLPGMGATMVSGGGGGEESWACCGGWGGGSAEAAPPAAGASMTYIPIKCNLVAVSDAPWRRDGDGGSGKTELCTCPSPIARTLQFKPEYGAFCVVLQQSLLWGGLALLCPCCFCSCFSFWGLKLS